MGAVVWWADVSGGGVGWWAQRGLGLARPAACWSNIPQTFLSNIPKQFLIKVS